MGLAHAIIRAANARGTHHYLAFDALDHLSCAGAAAWVDLFHKHAKIYAEGAKAPDDEFKDFQNHVLHPRDRYWGGAPAKAQAWYDNLVAALGRGDWPTAVWCAGVLSHYTLDPLMPFHTAQSEAENNIHAAVEWSISRAYDDIAALSEANPAASPVLSRDANWLALAVCAGSDLANAGYEKLIAHYDIHRGVVDPPSGLDSIARRLVAGMIGHGVRLFAAVLDRAVEEAKVAPPQTSLALETAAAVLSMPLAKWRKRRLDAATRAQIEAMYDELLRTGTVESNLRDEEKVIRAAFAREVLSKAEQIEPAKIFPFAAKATPPTRIERQRLPLAPAQAEAAPAAQATTTPAPVARPRAGAALHLVASNEKPAPTARPTRVHLTGGHDVVDAPSIGPKMAERLRAVGIDTVDDLLKAHPIALAARLDNRHVDEQVVTDWQDQTRLVCSVPGPRGTHAQLLVGAGYRTLEAVAGADPDRLCADVLRFAATPDGARILRDGNPPDIERIRGWLDAARSVRAA